MYSQKPQESDRKITMTKKDYETIALAVNKMKSLGDNHEYVADMLAIELAKHNPKFKRDKFLAACGVATNV